MKKVQRKLSNAEIASFCSQMALLLQAGIMPTDCMSILIDDTKDEESREILSDILHSCMEGEHFYTALSATGVFPTYVITMITIGENSGYLDEVMQSLSDFYDREENILDSIKNAITYPIIMIFMMFIVILILLTKVLPIFQQVFEQLGTDLQGISLQLMKFGQTMEKCSLIIMVFLLFIAGITFWGTHTVTGRKSLSKFFIKLPFTTSFQDKLAAGRFASGMALMLSSGLDISKSLLLVSDLVANDRMIIKINVCRNALEEGYNLSEALIRADIFTHLYSRMVAVGFKSGNLPKVMKKISECYETETSKRIQTIVSVIEPTLVIILSIIVGIILMSVILPLISVMSNIG